VTAEFRLRLGNLLLLTGTTNIDEDWQPVQVPAAHNLEYGNIISRDNKLRTRVRNHPLFARGATGQYQRIVIDDDAVYSFTPPGNFGSLHIATTSVATGGAGIVQYRTSAAALGVATGLLVDGGGMAATTGNLSAGASGANDGKFIVSVGASDGKIHFKNRLGSQTFVSFFVTPFGDG